MEKLALARAALAGAEQKTGVNQRVSAAQVADNTAAPAQSPETAVLRGEVLTISPQLNQLYRGGLRCGEISVVSGSAGLILATVASATAAGTWVAIAGYPEIGLLAAARLGADLSRITLVPDLGVGGPQVLAALLDGFELVVIGPAVVLSASEQRLLRARARMRSSAIISTVTWTGAAYRAEVVSRRWSGFTGAGGGYLREQQLEVAVGFDRYQVLLTSGGVEQVQLLSAQRAQKPGLKLVG